MLNLHLHDNGWTIFLQDINLVEVSDKELSLISHLLRTYPLIIARNQHFSIKEEVSIIKKFPTWQWPLSPTHGDTFVAENSNFLVEQSEGYLLKVTESGIFGNPEGLDWHTDNPSLHKNKTISYLYSVKGSIGSLTTFNNSSLAFQEMEEKEKILKLKCITARGDVIPVVNEYGFFFPFRQIDKLENEDHSLIENIGAHITNEKYCYHHAWHDGDVILSNQTSSIHKRWPFKNMAERVLHKSIMGFM